MGGLLAGFEDLATGLLRTCFHQLLEFRPKVFARGGGRKTVCERLPSRKPPYLGWVRGQKRETRVFISGEHLLGGAALIEDFALFKKRLILEGSNHHPGFFATLRDGSIAGDPLRFIIFIEK